MPHAPIHFGRVALRHEEVNTINAVAVHAPVRALTVVRDKPDRGIEHSRTRPEVFCHCVAEIPPAQSIAASEEQDLLRCVLAQDDRTRVVIVLHPEVERLKRSP